MLETTTALLIDGSDICTRLSIGKSKFHGMIRAGQFPIKPIRLGRSVRYSASELAEWVAAGCPPAERWEARKKLINR